MKEEGGEAARKEEMDKVRKGAEKKKDEAKGEEREKEK